MPQITIRQNTFLKNLLAPARSVPRELRATLLQGSTIATKNAEQDRLQHHWIKLTEPVFADDGETYLHEGFVYSPHLTIEDQSVRNVRLKVDYLSQLNNATSWHGSPHRQCCLTSNTMLANFLKDGQISLASTSAGFTQPDSYYGKLLREDFEADTTDHDGHTALLRSLGIDSYWSRSLSPQDVRRSLNAGIPVVVGVAFKASGHIVLIVGYDNDSGDWLVHDPYGVRYGASNSYDTALSGAYDRYSQSTMDQIFWDHGAEAGWGRIVTAVDDKNTGLPKGL